MQIPTEYQKNHHSWSVKSEKRRNITMTSEEVARQVDEYLGRGGKIEMLPGFENNEPKYRIEDAGFYDRMMS